MSTIQTRLRGSLVNEVSPASVFFIATPSDTIDLPQSVKAVYCTGAGNMVAQDWAETPNTTTIAMAAGQQLNLRVRKIMATGTTGSYMVMLG